VEKVKYSGMGAASEGLLRLRPIRRECLLCYDEAARRWYFTPNIVNSSAIGFLAISAPLTARNRQEKLGRMYLSSQAWIASHNGEIVLLHDALRRWILFTTPKRYFRCSRPNSVPSLFVLLLFLSNSDDLSHKFGLLHVIDLVRDKTPTYSIYRASF